MMSCIRSEIQDLDDLSVQTTTCERELYSPWRLTIISIYVGVQFFDRFVSFAAKIYLLAFAVKPKLIDSSSFAHICNKKNSP